MSFSFSFFKIDDIGLEDGCPIAGMSPEPPEVIAVNMTGAVRCCSYDGMDCITPKSCLIVTYSMAEEECAANGRRLCTSSELAENKCCGTGCNFDSELTWYNNETKGQ